MESSRPAIMLSLSSLQYWLKGFPYLPRADSMLASLSRPGLELDGVEIPLSLEEILSIAASRMPTKGGLFSLSPSCRRRLLSLPANSIHVTEIEGLAEANGARFARALSATAEALGVAEFT